MDTISDNLQHIELNIFHDQKEIFSGLLKDLPTLNIKDHTNHRVEVLGSEGSCIMSMNYGDFKSMITD